MGKLRTVIRKVDGNHTEIVQSFRRMGYSVLDLHILGKGAPDICVGKFGVNTLIEIKDSNLPKSKRTLTEDEEIFWKTWLGRLVMITSVDDVIAFDRKHHQRIRDGSL